MAGVEEDVKAWGVGGRSEEKPLQKAGWVMWRRVWGGGRATSATLSRRIGGVVKVLSTCPELRRGKGALKARGQANAPTSRRGGRRARIHHESLQGTGQVTGVVVGHDTADHQSSAEKQEIMCMKVL
ncbi:hypothetical protein CHARACLAT_005640 [Characodon lateralis]|uniref:Uncharacterized protein n=1 Tax=Characodon lateralis TaxID=208331 RepID=A0ABU7CN31_9TELE|nr:hypothetical protein [Characodon lateralis]